MIDPRAALALALITLVTGVGIGWIAGSKDAQHRQHDWGEQMRHDNAKLRAGAETLMTEIDRQEVEIGRLAMLVRACADALLGVAKQVPPEAGHALLITRAGLLRKLDVGDPKRLEDR